MLQAVTMETTAADLCMCVPVTVCVGFLVCVVFVLYLHISSFESVGVYSSNVSVCVYVTPPTLTPPSSFPIPLGGSPPEAGV